MAENKCPFELPVHKEQRHQTQGGEYLYEVIDNIGEVLAKYLFENQADWFVKVFNCHDKLVKVCRKGHTRLLELGQSKSYRTLKILKEALEAEKE